MNNKKVKDMIKELRLASNSGEAQAKNEIKILLKVLSYEDKADLIVSENSDTANMIVRNIIYDKLKYDEVTEYTNKRIDKIINDLINSIIQ